MTVQEIQDIASLQKHISELEEQAKALVSALKELAEPCTRTDYTIGQLDKIVISRAKQALEAYEAWKKENE